MQFLKKYCRPLILLAILGIITILDGIYGWSDYLGNMDNFRFLLDSVRENLLAAMLIYCVLTVIGCVVLALPGITFAVLAGLLFGPWLGTLACLVATTAGAVAAFLVGRFFLQGSVKPLVMKNRWLKKVLFDGGDRSDLVMLMITRLVPLFPYNLQNFAYGITDISLASYTIYTFLFMLPGVALFTIGSAGFTAQSGQWMYFASAGILLIVVFGAGWLIRKKYLKTPASRKTNLSHKKTDME